MHMHPDYAFAKELRAIARLTGLHVVWKNALGLGRSGVSFRMHLHQNTFCQAVQRHGANLKRCSRDDNEIASDEARRCRGPFCKTCHAGVTELVVPLFDGDQYHGLLYLGPVRREGQRCPYRHAREHFHRLPLLAPAAFIHAQRILTGLAARYVQRLHATGIESNRTGNIVRDPRIEDAIRFMVAHLHTTISVEQLANRACLSLSRFQHLFKEETGHAPKRWLTRVRMDRAKALLANTALRIGDIAAETGYAEGNYFSLTFRNEEGKTPSEYRREKQHRIEA